MCAPIALCTPAHRVQRNTPILYDAHSTSSMIMEKNILKKFNKNNVIYLEYYNKEIKLKKKRVLIFFCIHSSYNMLIWYFYYLFTYYTIVNEIMVQLGILFEFILIYACIIVYRAMICARGT